MTILALNEEWRFYSTLDQAYTQFIDSLADRSRDHIDLADAINTQVVEILKNVEKRNEDTRKKVDRSFYTTIHLR